MMMWRSLLLCLLLVASNVTPAAAQSLIGAASVIDGDTIEIRGQRIRLFGIDAPEGRQRCERDGRAYRCGQEAALALADKIGRRTIRCEFRLTRAGKDLVGNPGSVFSMVTPSYLFEVDHLRFGRVRERLLGNWDIFLNVLNVEAEDGITGLDLRRELYGEPDTGTGFDTIVSSLYVQVLRPLCWTGLLHEQRQHGFRLSTSIFTKTPLWPAALRLNTDDTVKPVVLH